MTKDILFVNDILLTDNALSALKKLGSVELYRPWKFEAEIAERAKDARVLVLAASKKLGCTVINSSHQLKGIAIYGMGYDKVDLRAATEKGVYVTNTPYTRESPAVAEAVFGYAICLSRNLLKAHQFVKSGDWTRFGPTTDKELSWLLGHDLFKRTIGIVGIGNIGRRVAKIANSFGMNVLAYDPYVTREGLEVGAELTDLDTLLRRADYVSLHTPLTSETKHLINERTIGLMKPTAFLINVSRGGVVDEKALIHALKTRRIAGAGLDVFQTEPIEADNELLTLDNVLLTPHCAGSSWDALETILRMLVGNIEEILTGKVPKNLVNPEAALKRS